MEAVATVTFGRLFFLHRCIEGVQWIWISDSVTMCAVTELTNITLGFEDLNFS